MTEPRRATPSPSPRDRILEAAAESFAEHGFAGARVDEIARRAQINKAMLYYHVGDKEELYQAVLVRNFERVLTTLQERIEPSAPASERLRTFIEVLTTRVSQRPLYPRIMLREVASGGAHLGPEVVQRILSVLTIVRSILEEGVATGELRPTNPLLTHLTMVGSVIFISSIGPFVERIGDQLPFADVPATPPDESQMAAFLHSLLLDGLRVATNQGEQS